MILNLLCRTNHNPPGLSTFLSVLAAEAGLHHSGRVVLPAVERSLNATRRGGLGAGDPSHSRTRRGFKGFFKGFTDGTHGYLVPYNNGAAFGKVARFDLATFSAVEVLDLTSTDGDLKGFYGGFTDGTHGYLVPYYNGAYFGKVARFEL